jgi:cytochrome c oxidase assembly protein subunit 11
MFGVGYALAPLYDVLCDAMGLNGKTTRVATMEPTGPVDATRTVTVELTGQAMAGLPWEFRPLTAKLDVHPGETVEVKYYARNRAAEAITGQAVPSVTPGRAASHFQKIECFCFSQQTLAAGEGREMPVRFTVSPKLNPDVHTITLSYAFFNTDKTQAARYGASPGKQAMPAQVQHAHHAGG